MPVSQPTRRRSAPPLPPIPESAPIEIVGYRPGQRVAFQVGNNPVQIGVLIEGTRRGSSALHLWIRGNDGHVWPLYHNEITVLRRL